MSTEQKLKITFKADSIDAFIERYAVDVSSGGVFIRVRDPLAVGSPLAFDFRLRDGSPMFVGRGMIVFARPFNSNNPQWEPGMGLRFDELDDGSAARFRQVLQAKERKEFPVEDGEGARVV